MGLYHFKYIFHFFLYYYYYFKYNLFFRASRCLIREMWPMNNISSLQAGAPNFIVLRGGRGGRSRGGRNYQKRKEGNFAGRKPYHNWKKKERVVTPELIDAKKIFVHSLPVHVS